MTRPQLNVMCETKEGCQRLRWKLGLVYARMRLDYKREKQIRYWEALEYALDAGLEKLKEGSR